MTFWLKVKLKTLCPSKLKGLTEEKRRKGFGGDCDKFCAEVNCLYESCIE